MAACDGGRRARAVAAAHGPSALHFELHRLGDRWIAVPLDSVVVVDAAGTAWERIRLKGWPDVMLRHPGGEIRLGGFAPG